MTSDKDLRLVLGLAIVLMVVGVVCYAYTASLAKPEEPIRVIYKSATGKVLFDHKRHLDESGYGIACVDCHHHPEEDETDTRTCGECHLVQITEGEVAEACMDCHESDDVVDTEMMKRSDAYHSQCTDCHKEAEAGPVECTDCHVR